MGKRKPYRDMSPEQQAKYRGYSAEYYKKNGPSPTQKVRRAKRRALLDALKAYPCLDCGGSFPPECMDFDHVRGEKVMSVGALVVSNAAWPRVLEEVEKCELVCANCHRIRTFSRRTT